MRYLNLARNSKSLFYVKQSDNVNQKFKLSVKLDDSWMIKSNSYWTYVINKEKKLPLQGWKIHLSVVVEEAQDLLNTVVPYLIEREISFKYIPNINAVIYRNSKYADRSESGKFITIYPQNIDEFATLLSDLKDLTKNFKEGPYILSDQAWQESNVYFRYGGFAPLYLEKNGEKVPAIYDEHRNLIEDQRVPYYRKPSFVKDPDIFKKNYFAEEEDFKPLLRYKIIGALHFSNAGGVYLGKKNGIKYVIKEGRKKAGLDANLLDGFSRVQREAKNLKLLINVPQVVNIRDEFTAWRHHYLVEDYIEGDTLEDILPEKFPFIKNEVNEANNYKEWVMSILLQLENTVSEIRKIGLAIGDLSLSNLLIDKDNKLHLIDLESAGLKNDSYVPGLTTVGFVSNNVKTFAEADRFALMRIAYYLFLPIEPVSDLTDDLHKQEDWIKQRFGQDVVKYLQHLKTNVHVENKKPLFIDHYLQVLDKDLQINTASEFRTKMCNGIINSLEYNSPTLFLGNNVEGITAYSFAYGISGLLDVVRQENKIPSQLSTWIRRHFGQLEKISEHTSQLGLMTGLCGISLELEKLEILDLADKIDQNVQINFDLKDQDISLESGLAGIGLYFKHKNKRDLVKEISDELKKRWKEINSLKDEDVGLLTGWGGVSLFFWEIGNRRFAQKILDNILTERISNENNLQVNDYSRGFLRVIPYLEDGVAGLALLLHKFMREDTELSLKYKNIYQKMIQSSYNYCTYQASVVSGLSGNLPVAVMQAKDGDPSLLEYTLDGLNNFLLKNDDGVFIPGRFGYKLELNYYYGSSGLLGMLELLKDGKKEFSWLPL